MPTKNVAPSRRPERRARPLPSQEADPSRSGFEIVIDGAVEYVLRLTPSDKVLGRFRSTVEAWPAVIAAVDGGRPPRMLVLDWIGADRSRGKVSSGVTLEYLARGGLGLPAEHLRRVRGS